MLFHSFFTEWTGEGWHVNISNALHSKQNYTHHSSNDFDKFVLNAFWKAKSLFMDFCVFV